jgi:hypothetical protein
LDEGAEGEENREAKDKTGMHIGEEEAMGTVADSYNTIQI